MNDNEGGKGLQFSTKKDRMIRVDDMEEKARVNLQVLVKRCSLQRVYSQSIAFDSNHHQRMSTGTFSS